MSNEIVPFEPAPDGNNNQQGNNEQQRAQPDGGKKRRRHKGGVRSREEYLAQLDALPRLVVTGLITPAQATAIKGVIATILTETHERQPAGSSPTANEDFIRAFRGNPGLLRLFEPLLSDEQLEMILRELADDDKPEA